MDIEEMKTQFCEKIQHLRVEAKWSVEELSLKSGVPLEMLEQLEQNILPKDLMLDDTAALAKVFHCEIHELFR